MSFKTFPHLSQVIFLAHVSLRVKRIITLPYNDCRLNQWQLLSLNSDLEKQFNKMSSMFTFSSFLSLFFLVTPISLQHLSTGSIQTLSHLHSHTRIDGDTPYAMYAGVSDFQFLSSSVPVYNSEMIQIKINTGKGYTGWAQEKPGTSFQLSLSSAATQGPLHSTSDDMG